MDTLSPKSIAATPKHCDQTPTHFDYKDIVAPAVPASGSERPSRLKMKRRAIRDPRGSSILVVKEESEKCSCCTKEEYWVTYDIFASIDRQREGAIRRGDFVWALSAHGASVDFQKIVRKSGLSAYFKTTARDISLQEFSKRVFPNATESDLQKMDRWSQLRKAYNLLTSANFTFSRDEQMNLFTLLTDSQAATVSATDLLRAQILSRVEILACLPATVEWELSFDDFKESVIPALVQKYGANKENLMLDSTPSSSAGSPVNGGLQKCFRQSKLQQKIQELDDVSTQASTCSSTRLSSVSATPVAPLPPGVVAELIKELSKTSPKGQGPQKSPHRSRYISEISGYVAEQLPIVPAF